MLFNYQEAQYNLMGISHTLFNLDLDKLEKPYLVAYMSHNSSKFVKRFERSQKWLKQQRLLIKIIT